MAALVAGSDGSAGAAHAHYGMRAVALAPPTLVYGTTEEPDTLNPEIMQLATSYDVNAAVFDSLLLPDAHDNVTGDLATSWSISPDNLTYTFHLRRRVRWADGVPFTARDVLFTYRQLMNSRNHNLSPAGWDHITRVVVPDDHTIICHTKKALASFLTDVGETAILPAHYFQHSPAFLKNGTYNHDPFNRTPWGTGPYVVTKWSPADHITLGPNKYYWGQKPYFQKVIVKIVPNVTTLLVQLRTNEVQLAGVTPQQAQQASGISGKMLLQRPGQAWYHIDLKQWGFLRQQSVRVALDYATPKMEILRKVLHGYGQVAYGDIAPVSWAYDPNVPRHPFNLKKAAAILAAAGFKKGPGGFLQKGGKELSMQLWYPSDDVAGARIDAILKDEWGQLGVRVDLHHQGVTTIFGPDGPQFTHQMTGLSYAWTNGNDLDDAYYWNSAAIPRCPTCTGGNDVGYFYRFSFQKQIDALTNAAAATVERATRKAIYARIETLLAEQVPVIFLAWQPLLYVQPKNLTGFSPNAFTNIFWNVARWHY